MLVVKIELHSFRTKKVSQIGEMRIWLKDSPQDDSRGSYDVAVVHDDGKFEDEFGAIPKKATRTGEVLNYPRLSYNVWRLVCRALRSAFPEEK